MTAAQYCLIHHPLHRAYSPTAAASGTVTYVVCGWQGCPQRRAVPAADWQAEVARRERETRTTPARDEPPYPPESATS